MSNLIKNTKYNKYLSISGDKINVYHYSNDKFSEFTFKKIGQLRSKQDVKNWGTDRIFFYTKPSCINLDHGVPDDYLYKCQVSLEKIYPIYENPLKLNKDIIDFYPIYNESSDLGYVGFIYSIQNNGSCPIIVIWDLSAIIINKITSKDDKEFTPQEIENESGVKFIGNVVIPGEKLKLTTGMDFKIDLYMDNNKNIIAKTDWGKEIKIDQYSDLYKKIYNKFGKNYKK